MGRGTGDPVKDRAIERAFFGETLGPPPAFSNAGASPAASPPVRRTPSNPISAPPRVSFSSSPFSQSLSGSFNPGRNVSQLGLAGAFNPGRTASQLENGGRAVRSMMDMANEYGARMEAMAPPPPPPPEYSMPDEAQDAFLRAQYESTGFIPTGGFETIYQDPSSLRSVEFMDTVHLVPRGWRGLEALPGEIEPYTQVTRQYRRPDIRTPGYRVGDRFVPADSPEGMRYEALRSSGSRLGANQQYLPAFAGNSNPGFAGASVGSVPTWRMNHGGLVPSRTKDYRGGGIVRSSVPRYGMGGMIPRYRGGGMVPRYQEGGITDAPMAMESMTVEESMPAGLNAAPQAMGMMEETEEVFPGMPNERLAQVAGSMPPEQIEMVKEEVKMALMGRHPQGDQLLAVVEVMFPGMIEEVAMSLQGTADGMTDSELALLAPGEYVVDARTVSDLGNGSTEAGGQAMDRMVQEIRMANTGSPAQPPAMDPMEFMPPDGMA